MSEYIEIEPGLVIDPDSGEIIAAPDGGDALLRVARRLVEAQTQERGWSVVIGAAKAALLKGQAEKTQRYDDTLVTVQQNVRKVFDAESFRLFLASTPELTREELFELARAAKDLDRGLLAEPLRTLVDDEFVNEVPTKPFILTKPVLREAPVRR